MGNRGRSRVNNPYALMGILLVMWGSYSAVSKLLFQKLDSFQVQFYIFAISLVLMTVSLLFNGKLSEFKKVTAKEYLRLFLYSLPSFLYYTFYNLALKLIPAVEASMLNYLFPLMIVIFAMPINGEKLDTAKLLSIIFGFAGMMLIITNGNFEGIRFSNLPGDLLAIGGAICWGVFSNLGKKNRTNQFVSNYVYIFVSFVFSTICIPLFSSFTVPGAEVFLGISWISLSNIVLSYYLWFKILKMTSSAVAASLSFITPFITLAFIMLILGEKIMIIQMAGFLLIVFGLGVQALYEAKLKRRLDQPVNNELQ